MKTLEHLKQKAFFKGQIMTGHEHFFKSTDFWEASKFVVRILIFLHIFFFSSLLMSCCFPTEHLKEDSFSVFKQVSHMKIRLVSLSLEPSAWGYLCTGKETPQRCGSAQHIKGGTFQIPVLWTAKCGGVISTAVSTSNSRGY